jgi:tyramine---L-glutamate ligase
LHSLPIKKIFVCEFITGGGLCGKPLASSLVKEGALMRDALLRDLAELPYDIMTTNDARLPASIHKACRAIAANENAWDVWAELIETCDAVLVIAPETDGILLKFAQLTHDLGKLWLGCSLDAIEICGDKLKTNEFLHTQGAPTPTFTLESFLSYENQDPNLLFKHGQHYVAKPRFGAGCEDTQVFAEMESLVKFMRHHRVNSHVIQLYIEGQHASFNMLCKQGQTWLLSANQQLITETNGQLQFSGVLVNGFAQHKAVFTSIAESLAAWLPGLNGLVGVDIVFTEKMASIIEINPRLTTSYVGLGESIGHNPAKLLLDCLLQAEFSLPKLKHKLVEIHV